MQVLRFTCLLALKNIRKERKKYNKLHSSCSLAEPTRSSEAPGVSWAGGRESVAPSGPWSASRSHLLPGGSAGLAPAPQLALQEEGPCSPAVASPVAPTPTVAHFKPAA